MQDAGSGFRHTPDRPDSQIQVKVTEKERKGKESDNDAGRDSNQHWGHMSPPPPPKFSVCAVSTLQLCPPSKVFPVPLHFMIQSGGAAATILYISNIMTDGNELEAVYAWDSIYFQAHSHNRPCKDIYLAMRCTCSVVSYICITRFARSSKPYHNYPCTHPGSPRKMGAWVRLRLCTHHIMFCMCYITLAPSD